jgi:hypothetical protein
MLYTIPSRIPILAAVVLLLMVLLPVPLRAEVCYELCFKNDADFPWCAYGGRISCCYCVGEESGTMYGPYGCESYCTESA